MTQEIIPQFAKYSRFKIGKFDIDIDVTLKKFCGMKLLIGKIMFPLIKRFFVSPEENRDFQSIRAIVVLLLVLSFQGAIVYIMVSSLS